MWSSCLIKIPCLYAWTKLFPVVKNIFERFQNDILPKDWGNAKLKKCQVEKCLVEKMHGCIKVANCLVEKMPSWKNSKMQKCLVAKMPSLKKCLTAKMLSCKNV